MPTADLVEFAQAAAAIEAAWKNFAAHAWTCQGCRVEAQYCRRPGLSSNDRHLATMHERLSVLGRPTFEQWRFEVVTLRELRT